MGHSWLEILEDPLVRKLLGHDAVLAEKQPFIAGVTSRLKFLLADPLKHLSFAKIGYSALEAFLQANCTGPPLDWDPEPVVFPEAYHDGIPQIKQEILRSLSLDGLDVYRLTPHIELFWLAKIVMSNDQLANEGFNGRRARFRVNFWHQKLFSEQADTLRDSLYRDADVLDSQLSSRLIYGGAAAEEHMVEFYIERANIRIYYGDERQAREDLHKAAQLRDFEYALTGALGKRTKFQQHDVSQLVVMAKSRDVEPEPYSSRKNSRADDGSRKSSVAERSVRSMSTRPQTPTFSPSQQLNEDPFDALSVRPKTTTGQPENLQLNDDTLLESIKFKRPPDPTTQIVTEQSHLPIRLAFMDPSEQPQLHPTDSIILLAIASSITNTQADDGLTREQTLPYASRVLDGGSSNWSVYTQALLVRSRVESHRSRTTERGLLQLQALVDQLIVELTSTTKSRTDGEADGSKTSGPSTFFPAAKDDERATVAERMRFIHQVSPPYRWELEAELAGRWTAMGGLKTALDIYERLQMFAEVALCLAATDREGESKKLLRSILFVDPDQSMKDGDTVMMKKPHPSDAPRLLCILGDVESAPKFYSLAWTLSSNRYARAQRSLGSFYLKKRDLEAAATAYAEALRITRFDNATWFSLGCVQLELSDYAGAVESFTKVVQLDDRDAQGWSNLAVGLLRLPVTKAELATSESKNANLATIAEKKLEDESDSDTAHAEIDPLQNTREALRALRRAAQLQRDDARIWDNFLTVAASIPPNPDDPARSTPWQDIIHAMDTIIVLRKEKAGEGCVDQKILSALIDHVTAVYDYPTGNDDEIEGIEPRSTQDASSPSADLEPTSPRTSRINSTDDGAKQSRPPLPFIVRATIRLIDKRIAPLATSDPNLFMLLARFSRWRHRPSEQLNLVEKSWRNVTNALDPKPADITKSTLALVSAYQELGPQERERTGGPVEKSWKFKSRSCLRSVMGKAKGVWDDTEDYQKLEEAMEGLKGTSE